MDPGQGETESPAGVGRSGLSPGRRRWAIIGSIVVIVIVVTVVSLPGLVVQPLGPEGPPVTSPLPGTTLAPPAIRTPGTMVPGSTPAMTMAPTTPMTPEGSVPPSPAPTPSATLPLTPVPTPGGPPGFTVSITPAHATARAGETVVYRMTIEAQNGFSGNIHMVVTASFLFFSQTQDLGYQEPPYPKTIEYPFTVPDTLPPGITVNGVVRSTGDGITREDQLSLTVE